MYYKNMNFLERKQSFSVMLVFFALLFPISMYAVKQHNKVFTFELRNVALKEVFNYIEKSSDYIFLYLSASERFSQ